eukprot:CAMPEP_0115527734 /NCGR_PEP_ID=MMETSP0271-20121206/83006_1 /TAXON_ID=71861 /ORGANISM="Scrippsiella trochoidea, Strain CCMP3099" /LENGTH=284 /DNA_ID=CAMNT_0002959589 /DNA_START=22 /DNA_END=874 /DNA_ORIENTATION=+
MEPPGFHGPEPDFMLGEESLGPQRSSLRPSSARYSFGRGGRSGNNSVSQDTPGPAAYAVAEAAASGVPTAFFGTGVQIEAAKPYQYPGLVEGEVNMDFVQSAAPCTVFGSEERGAQVVDPELVRNCPECRLGKSGPGFVYTPSDRSVSRGRRPSSAPSYSMPGRGTALHQKELQSRSSAQAGPNSYRSEGALGVQHNSRRTTGRSSSFSRSERFPEPKGAQGQATQSAHQGPRRSDVATLARPGSGGRHLRALALRRGMAVHGHGSAEGVLIARQALGLAGPTC